MKLVFDIDGVLIPSPEKVQELTKAFFPDLEDFVIDHYSPKKLACREEIRRFVHGMFSSEAVLTCCPPYIAVRQIFREIRSAHDVVVLTSRPITMYDETAKQIFHHFGAVPIFWERPKAVFIEHYGYDVLIDDNPDEVVQGLRSVCDVIMPVTPYNKFLVTEDRGHKQFHPVKGFADIPETINKIIARKQQSLCRT